MIGSDPEDDGRDDATLLRDSYFCADDSSRSRVTSDGVTIA